MAQTTGTYSSYDSVGQREELANMIYRITPDDTPVFTWVTKTKLKSKHPEWQTDVLEAPAENAQVEGDNYSYAAKTPTVRVGNYTQIFRKTGLTSGTQDAIDLAGRERETVYQKMKSGLALRKDVEYAIIGNRASAAGSDTVARTSAGIPAWLTTNDSRGSGGAEGGFSAGIVAAETTGTQRAFTKTILDDCMALAFNSGGNVKDVFVSPYVKRVFSTFMSDSNVALQRYMAKMDNNTIIASAEVYRGDFDTVTFHTDRVMATEAGTARRALGLDKSKVAWGWLRPIQEDDTAKTGDAEPYVLIGEGALIMKNEAAHWVAADLYGLTAST